MSQIEEEDKARFESGRNTAEEPAEMFVTVIGQKILTDEDCVTVLSKYIFHNGIFGKFSFLTGEVVYKLGSNGAEVPTVCNDDLRIGSIYRWHNGFEYICCSRNPQLDIELCGLICHMFFLLMSLWVQSVYLIIPAIIYKRTSHRR